MMVTGTLPVFHRIKDSSDCSVSTLKCTCRRAWIQSCNVTIFKFIYRGQKMKVPHAFVWTIRG